MECPCAGTDCHVDCMTGDWLPSDPPCWPHFLTSLLRVGVRLELGSWLIEEAMVMASAAFYHQRMSSNEDHNGFILFLTQYASLAQGAMVYSICV